jgi:hypothetical protein
MKKIAIISVALVALLVSAGLALAYKGDPSVKGPNFSEERHAEMQAAFDNLDYSAWYSLMTQDGRHPKVVDVVTEENFAKFVEARNASLSGDKEKALELKKELGLGLGQMKHLNGFEKGYSHGFKQGLKQGRGNCMNN